MTRVPTYKEIGYIGGMRIATNQFQSILVNIDIELGKYPIYNEASGFGGHCRFGIGLHKVK